MISFRQTFWCTVAVLAACFISNAAVMQSLPGYSRRVWQMGDGLPQDTVQALAQTRDGYLWVGTSNGLARFDGVRFVVFNHRNTPLFRDDSIVALCPGSDGRLWIGTEGGGLLLYRNGSFRAFGEPEGLTNQFVRALYEDRWRNLWVGTDRGLFRLAGGKLSRVDNRGELPLLSVRVLHEDREGRLWAGGSMLVALDGAAGRPVRSIPGPGIGSIYETRDGTLWVGSMRGLYRLKDGAVKRVPLRSKSGGDTVSALCEDSGGTLWLGMFGGGLSRYHAGRFELYRAPEMLPDNGILAILKDGERNLWVGTRAGLLRLSQTAVQTLTTHDGLADDNIRTTYADRDGAIWLVSFNGPAHRLVGDRAVRVPIPALPARSMLRTVFRDRRGALWIGTTGQGVVRVGNGTAVHYTRKEGLVNDFVRVFCEDREGRIWIGTDSGLSCWTAGRFRNFQIQEGLAYGSVRAIAEDRTGDLWVGTDAGLSRFHDGAFLRDPLLERFRNEKIWAIHEDARGALWLGTRGAGLFRIENGRVANLTTRNGLPDDNIYQILEDGRGNLWMSNPTGVFCASRRSIEAVAEGGTQQFAAARYGTSDGMTVPQINGGVQPAGCITSAGILWFPSIRGAVRIDPDKIRAGRAASALIEEVVADGHAIAAADGMELPPGDGKLEIHYTAPKLLSPETVRFRYMLEGFDRNWTDALERRVAYYTNLPPREYRFRVIAIDGNGVPPVSEASLGLRLRPHYYETRWFYSFCTLLFFASMWCVFQLHTRQTKARYAAVLAERNRMARDMHDTLIQGCVGISTLLEAASAVRGSAPEMIHELLDRARDQVHSTLQEARQAVWDLRQISLDTRGLVSALSQVAEQAGREYGFEVRFESGGTPAVLDYRTERGLLLVVREAVRNAIVHGAPREVRVSLRFERRRLRLEIADDGCGFHPAAETATPGHCGLVGMRERVEQLGGKFELRSTAGLGTNILVTLPFNRGRSVLEGRKAES